MAFNPPHHSNELLVSFPSHHVLQLTLNRPESLNALSPQLSGDLKTILEWFEHEPSLWVVIVTGAGRIFCAGADLKALHNDKQRANNGQGLAGDIHGFGSILRWQSNKPMIAAVIGGAYGGGVEMMLNCDIVIAADDAKFAFPEVKRGIVAVQGGIPRLAQVAGHQLASELLLTGRTIGAVEAQNRFRFVNMVVPSSEVIGTAVAFAQQIIENSPDAVQSTKKGLLLSQTHNFQDTLLAHVSSPQSKRVYKGENIKEGLKAFAEKRAPAWKNPSKL